MKDAPHRDDHSLNDDGGYDFHDVVIDSVIDDGDDDAYDRFPRVAYCRGFYFVIDDDDVAFCFHSCFYCSYEIVRL